MQRCLPLLILALGLILPASAQTLSASSGPVRTALAHLRAEAPALGLKGADADELTISSAYRDARSGASYVYVQQRLDGIDIADALVTVVVGADGEVQSAAGDLVSGTASASKSAGLSAAVALARVAGLVGETLPATTSALAVGGADRRTEFGTVAGDPVTARLVYAPTERAGLRLAWEVNLPSSDTQHNWVIRVDAQTGAELSRYDLVVHDTFGPTVADYTPLAVPGWPEWIPAPPAQPAPASSYTVYPFPLEAPHFTAPGSPAGDRAVLVNPEFLAASPFGWHDNNGDDTPEFTTTQGNNVHAYTDTDANNVPDTGSSPDGGATLTFDFPVDLAQAPSAYRPASVVNLFYWNNIIHDVMVPYGFTEAAGNFQTFNYSGLGAGNDYVQAESQDGSGTNNANFSTPPDGTRPRMQMYVGVDVSPNRDGSFDNGVVVHEYGHGISNRLTGGPAAFTCLQNAEQQGEGWSDFYAAMFTMQPGQTRTTSRSIGTYLFAQGPAGGGIRLAPYNTSFAVNNYTYGRTRTMTAVHQIGFVWATVLWEATWDMIDAHGYSPNLYDASGTAGNQIMMNLVTRGLAMQPCSPGFVSSRDAILAADASLYPDAANPGKGVHYNTLWKAFARRGLGLSASQGATTTNTDNTEAFDAPLPTPVATVVPTSLAFAVPTGGTATRTVTIRNTAAAGSGDLNVRAALGNYVPNFTGGGAVAKLVPDAPRTTSGAITVRSTGADIREREAETAALPIQVPASRANSGSQTSSAAAVDCTEGQLFEQLAADTGLSTVSGATEMGQSFTATCKGFLNSIIPVISTTSALNRGVTWGFTVRVYEGAGTGGTLVASPSYTFTNPTTSTAFLLTLPLPTPVALVEGQTYTWFLDLTSNRTGLQYHSNSATYAGGTRYLTTNGNPANAAATTGDMQFQLGLGAPNRIVKLPTPIASAPAGGSATFDVSVDATGFADGTYTADLVLTTNDPARPTITVPMTIVVGPNAASSVLTTVGDHFFSPAQAGMTVADVAALNLVRGVPGYAAGRTNLLTTYDGTKWLSATGAGEVLELGRAVRWFLQDGNQDFGSGSVLRPLPTVLTTDTPNTADVTVTLSTTGDHTNMLGNPFGVPLDVSNVGSWSGGDKVGFAFLWNVATKSWIYSPTGQAEPWQAFFVKTRRNRPGTLTIPASAAIGSAAWVDAQSNKAPAPELGVLRFALDGTALDGSKLSDGALALVVGDDLDSEAKLRPLSTAYVAAGFSDEAVLGAIEALRADGGSRELPIAITTVGAQSELTLRWDAPANLPDGWRLTLVDRQAGRTMDLTAAGSYDFQAGTAPARADVAETIESIPTAEARDRFVLRIDTGDGAFAASKTADLSLSAPFPNPTGANSQIAFTLAEAGAARLSVIDALGREVAVLTDGDLVEGEHRATFDASRLATGLYMVRLAAGGQVMTQRVTVVR